MRRAPTGRCGGTWHRRHPPRSSDRPSPAARQRRRHRVQPDRRPARLHRGRHGQGRQRSLRLRHPQRTDGDARQRRAGIRPSRRGTRTATALAVAQGHRRREDAREGQRAGRLHRRPGRARPTTTIAPTAGHPRSAKGRRLPEGWVVSDRAALHVERRQQARLLRHQGAGRGAGHDPAHDRRDSGRRRVEHGGRAHPVAADDARRAGSQLHVPAGVRRRGIAVRQARGRDDARPRRRAGRQVGGRTRHAGLHPRLQAARGRHLSRQHLHRRAHADDEGPADRRPHLRHLAARHATSSTGRTTASRPTTSMPATREAARQRHRASASSTSSSTIPVPSRPTALAGYTSDGKAAIAQTPLRPVADAARRIGAEEPDQRHRREERDPLPLRADRAGRPRRVPRAVGPRGTIDLSKPITLSAYGAVDEEVRLLRAGGRTS